MKGISPNFGHRCICVHRCADELLGSEVVTAGSDAKNGWIQYLCKYFHQNWIIYVTYWLGSRWQPVKFHLVIHVYFLPLWTSYQLRFPGHQVSLVSQWSVEYAVCLHGLAQQWRPWKKQNLAQRYTRRGGWCSNSKYMHRHNAGKSCDTTLDTEK